MTHVFTEEKAETVRATPQNASWVAEQWSRVCGEVLCLAVCHRGRGMEGRFVGALRALLCAPCPTRVSSRCVPVIYQVPLLDFPGVQAISPLLLPSTSMIIWALMHTGDYKAVIYGPATKVPIIC